MGKLPRLSRIRSILIPTICIGRGGAPSCMVLMDVNRKVAQVEQYKIPIDTYHMHRERGNSIAGSDGCEWGSCPGCA
jgi:hypothetical protein